MTNINNGDKIRNKLIEKATALIIHSKGKVPDFSQMENGDIIRLIRLLNLYIEGK